jgi:hypothetical protein
MRLRLGLFAALAIVSVLLVVGWYTAMNVRRDKALSEHNVPRVARNALLHSIAGADTYSAFRRIGFGRDRALRSTEFLGYCNEWFEHWTKRMDVTAEVYKDLHNNLYGVTVAAWLEATGLRNSRQNRAAVLAWLTRERRMPWWPAEMASGLPLDRYETAPAMRFYEGRRAELRNAMRDELNTHRTEIVAWMGRRAKV